MIPKTIPKAYLGLLGSELRVLNVRWNDGELFQVNAWPSDQKLRWVRTGQCPLEGHVLDVIHLVLVIYTASVIGSLNQRSFV